MRLCIKRMITGWGSRDAHTVRSDAFYFYGYMPMVERIKANMHRGAHDLWPVTLKMVAAAPLKRDVLSLATHGHMPHYLGARP